MTRKNEKIVVKMDHDTLKFFTSLFEAYPEVLEKDYSKKQADARVDRESKVVDQKLKDVTEQLGLEYLQESLANYRHKSEEEYYEHLRNEGVGEYADARKKAQALAIMELNMSDTTDEQFEGGQRPGEVIRDV